MPQSHEIEGRQDPTLLRWTNRNFKKDLHDASKRVAQEEKRQKEILTRDNYFEELIKADVFNYDLDPEEFKALWQSDKDRYYRIAGVCIDLINAGERPEEGVWAKAKSLLEERMESGEKWLERISRYQNSRLPAGYYPREPKPKGESPKKKLYDDRHRARRKTSKSDLMSPSWQRYNKARAANKRAQIFRDNELTDELADKAINTQQATIADLEANPFDQRPPLS